MIYSGSMMLRATMVAAAAGILAFNVTAAGAQQAEETIIRNHIKVTQADIAAAGNVKNSYFHVKAANLPGAQELARALNAENEKRVAQLRSNGEALVLKPGATLAAPYFYPGDLAKGSGSALTTTVQHALYVDYSGTVAANWGNPEGFLTDLSKSTYVHVMDQYAGLTTNSRYTVGANASMSYSFFGNVIYEHDIWAIVYAAAKKSGTGTGHLYHVFLPKGIDTCFDFNGGCYSPDNPSTFAFCGYHDAVGFSDIGSVYFTVEPYQMVPGCQVATPSPNGQLADSTNSVLLHETFEAITDPIPGYGFINRIAASAQGSEIGDECQSLGDANGNVLDPTFLINGKKYEVQLAYSNTYHACVDQP